MGSSWTRWGIGLGVALGGFFDGILLHQILQWHHLLSLVPGMTDLRTQVLWDGYFHALMYVLAAVALWGLWRMRLEGSGRALAGALLVGFGLWHVADSVLSHWLLGIHRIRVDSDAPLVWDLIWFTAFGLAPLALGWLVLRRRGRPLRRAGLGVALVGAVSAGAGAWALREPAGQPFTTVVFAPGVTPAQALSAVGEAGGRLVWTDLGAAVVVAEIPEEGRWRLYRRGALLVSGAGLPAGCAAWGRT